MCRHYFSLFIYCYIFCHAPEPNLGFWMRTPFLLCLINKILFSYSSGRNFFNYKTEIFIILHLMFYILTDEFPQVSLIGMQQLNDKIDNY